MTTTIMRAPARDNPQETAMQPSPSPPKRRSGVTVLSETQRQKREAAVLAALSGGPATRGDVVRRTGLSHSTVWRTIIDLTTAGRVREAREALKPARGPSALKYEVVEADPVEPEPSFLVRRHPQDVLLFGERAAVVGSIRGRVYRHLVDDERELAA